MDEKQLIFETLEFLSQELLREKFNTQRIRRDQKALAFEKRLAYKKLREIRNRINYNLDEHKTAIAEEEDEKES